MILPVKTSHTVVALCLGVAVALLGFFLYFIGVPLIVEQQIHDKVSVHNGSQTYPLWRKMDFLEFNAYLFNLSNPEGVAQGEKPVLKELGPFCYRLVKTKDESAVSEAYDTIVYDEHRYFYPISSTNLTDKPCMPHDTPLTMVNVALLVSIQIIGEMSPYFLQTFAETIPILFTGIEDPFIRTTAGQILFDGMPVNCSSQDITVSLVCKAMKVLAPPQLKPAPNGRDYIFSMLGFMNATRIGPFKILRGVKNMPDTGATLEWEGKQKMNIWSEPRCNEIKGTDGYILPPVTEDVAHIDLFAVDICRSMSLRYVNDTVVKGFPVRHFEVTRDILDNSKENECYCPMVTNPETNQKTRKCLKDGVMSLAPCFNKAPVILSWPHFYLASEDYQKGIEGLHPDANIHKSEADFQIPIGAPIFGIKRAQMNLFLERSDIIPMISNITEVLMPLVWIEEGAYTPEAMLDEVRTSTNLLNILNVVVQVMGYCGIAFAVLVIIAMLNMKSKSKPYVLNK